MCQWQQYCQRPHSQYGDHWVDRDVHDQAGQGLYPQAAQEHQKLLTDYKFEVRRLIRSY